MYHWCIDYKNISLFNKYPSFNEYFKHRYLSGLILGTKDKTITHTEKTSYSFGVYIQGGETENEQNKEIKCKVCQKVKHTKEKNKAGKENRNRVWYKVMREVL